MTASGRKIVIINQAVNYLTIGICNEFQKCFDKVALITGSVHEQGEKLDHRISISKITRWREEHGVKKALIYFKALFQINYLLIKKNKIIVVRVKIINWGFIF